MQAQGNLTRYISNENLSPWHNLTSQLAAFVFPTPSPSPKQDHAHFHELYQVAIKAEQKRCFCLLSKGMQLRHIRASSMERLSTFLHQDRWAQYWAPRCLSYWLPAAVAHCLLWLDTTPELFIHPCKALHLVIPKGQAVCSVASLVPLLAAVPSLPPAARAGRAGHGKCFQHCSHHSCDSTCPHSHWHILMLLELSLPAAWWGLPPGKGMVLSELLQATQTGRTCAEL